MDAPQTTASLVDEIAAMAKHMIYLYCKKTGSYDKSVAVIGASVPESDQQRDLEYFACRAEQLAFAYRESIAVLIIVWNNGVVIKCNEFPNNLPGFKFNAPQDRAKLGKMISDKIHESSNGAKEKRNRIV